MILVPGFPRLKEWAYAGFTIDLVNAIGGTFYNYERGKKYKSIIKLKGENVLKIRGYTVLSPLGKTTTWIRVQ